MKPNLSERYDEYNKLYFENEMPKCSFGWKRMKALGRAYYKKAHPEATPTYEIKMSDLYDLNEKDFKQIFLHEMVHIYLYSKDKLKHGHGKIFKAQARIIEQRANVENIHKRLFPVFDVPLTKAGIVPVYVLPHALKGRFAFFEKKYFNKNRKMYAENNIFPTLIRSNLFKKHKLNKGKLVLYGKFNEQESEKLMYLISEKKKYMIA